MYAQSYARTYRSTAVLTASPGQLVLMLYDGALRNIAQALEAFQRPTDDIPRITLINDHLLKAQRILAELQSTLNMDAGDGSLSREMYRLYDYYLHRLTESNMRKDPAPAAEVEKLLRTLRDGWSEMLTKVGETAKIEAMQGVA